MEIPPSAPFRLPVKLGCLYFPVRPLQVPTTVHTHLKQPGRPRAGHILETGGGDRQVRPLSGRPGPICAAAATVAGGTRCVALRGKPVTLRREFFVLFCCHFFVLS